MGSGMYPCGHPIDKWDISVAKIWKTCPGTPNTRTRTHGETHIQGAASGRLHKRGRAAFGRPPPFVDSLYMGLAMGTRPCIWAAWAGFPDFHNANVSFCLWVSPWVRAQARLTPAWPYIKDPAQGTLGV